MRFVDIQKRQWDKDTKNKDDFEKLAYYCNTVYSTLNCRIKRCLKRLGMRPNWSTHTYYKISNDNKDKWGGRKITFEDFQ